MGILSFHGHANNSLVGTLKKLETICLKPPEIKTLTMTIETNINPAALSSARPAAPAEADCHPPQPSMYTRIPAPRVAWLPLAAYYAALLWAHPA